MVLLDHGKRRALARAVRLQLFQSHGHEAAVNSGTRHDRCARVVSWGCGYDWARKAMDSHAQTAEKPSRRATDRPGLHLAARSSVAAEWLVAAASCS